MPTAPDAQGRHLEAAGARPGIPTSRPAPRVRLSAGPRGTQAAPGTGRAGLGTVAALLAAVRDAQSSAGAGDPVDYPPPPPAGRWVPDVLGPGFEARTLPLETDDEGEVAATMVRYVPGREHRRLRALAPRSTPDDGPVARTGPCRYAVLYLHGWNDYFFQTHLAEFWHGLGGAFYALDLRRYGRSLRTHQSPGYVRDLAEYDEELEAALAVVAAEQGTDVPVVVNGHSTGGLVTALWAHRHPGRLAGLVLNSPWLELQGSAMLRNLTMPVVEHLARVQPRTPLPFVDLGHYTRLVDAAEGGAWPVERRWRRPRAMPVWPAWLRAIMAGHADVAAGLHIDAPVLVLSSARTVISLVWSEDMRSSDTVLDVDQLRRRAVALGPVVTVVSLDGALHDVVLSQPPVRDRAFAEISRWVRAYVGAGRR